MDKYDEAVKFLTENSVLINAAWNCPVQNRERGGVLFEYVAPDDAARVRSYFGAKDCGCLTQIRAGIRYAVDEDGRVDEGLTAEIRADTRIPVRADDITVESLPVFAEWQRALDERFGRSAS